jgi:hypothetical protein
MNLAEELRIENPEILAELENDATGLHRTASGARCPDTTLRDFREALDNMYSALERIGRGSCTKAARNRLIRGLDKIPTGYDIYPDSLLGWPPGTFRKKAVSLAELSNADMERTADDLRQAVEAVRSELRSPGRGNGGRRSRQYMLGIARLADRFAKALPQHSLSPSPHTKFHAYVRHWFWNYVGDEVEDPERHIRAALNDRTNWHPLR